MLDIMHIFCYNEVDYNFLEVLGLQFITTGNRIAVENFTLGDLYTITFTNGTYINSACIGIGENFVSFQRNEPELLFTLNMETAELVSSIDLYAGGTGTNNYNDLTNKPQINDVELVGNKSLSDLGIQPTISDLDTIRSGAAAGATAVQPAALADYQPKIDSSHKLDADLVDDTSSTHKFATAAQLSQIGINENNISYNTNAGFLRKNFYDLVGAVYTGNGAYNKGDDSITIYTTGGAWKNISSVLNAPSGNYKLKFKITNYSSSGGAIQINTYTNDTAETLISRSIITGNGEYTADVEIPAQGAKITFSINYSSDTTVSNSITVSECMLYSASISDTTYQPYALSNVELTAAIQAIQVQLANQ